MDDEDEDLDVGGGPALPASEPEAPTGALTAVRGSFATAQGDPALRSDYLRTRETAQSQQRDYLSMMDAAIQRALQRRTGPSDSEMYLRMAGALGKPTRTGSFGESLGSLADTTADVMAARRKGETDRDNAVDTLRLASSKAGLDFASRDASLAAQVYLRDRAKVPDRLALIKAWQEAPEGPMKAELRKAIDADLSRGQPRPAAAAREPEVVRLQAIIDDPQATPSAKETARARLTKLNHIPPPPRDTSGEKGRWVKVAEGDDGILYQHTLTNEQEVRPWPAGFNRQTGRADPDSQRVLAARVGVPISDVDPFSGMKPAEVAKFRQRLDADAEKTLAEWSKEESESQSGIQQAKRFIELNKKVETGRVSGMFPSVSAEAREMESIISKLAPTNRLPGTGAVSDFDAKELKNAVFGMDKPLAANQSIANAIIAANTLSVQKSQFLRDYKDVNGHLQGAERKWRDYINANPILDPKKPGQYALNPSRKNYQDYFASKKPDMSEPVKKAEGGRVRVVRGQDGKLTRG